MASFCGSECKTSLFLGDFEWIRVTGATSSEDTGPSSDHTSGKGYYVYIETSRPEAEPGYKALLVSPWMPPLSQGVCFRCVAVLK